MNNDTTVGLLAWVFKQFGGRKMSIWLATYGGIIYTVAQMAQGHVQGAAYQGIAILLAVLGALGVGQSYTIAKEDGKRAMAAATADAAKVTADATVDAARVTASAMVEASRNETKTANVHLEIAKAQSLGAAPSALNL